MKNFKKLLILPSLIIVCTIVRAQEAIISAGDYNETSTGSISWSLGETVTETFRTDQLILTQGFQQPTYTVTAIKEYQGLEFQIMVFPNPAREYIIIKVDTENFEQLIYEIYDFKGLILSQKQFDSNLMNVSMKDMKPAVYFIRIIDGNKVLKTYKIVKQ